jgi:hypothetical protein
MLYANNFITVRFFFVFVQQQTHLIEINDNVVYTKDDDDDDEATNKQNKSRPVALINTEQKL